MRTVLRYNNLIPALRDPGQEIATDGIDLAPQRGRCIAAIEQHQHPTELGVDSEGRLFHRAPSVGPPPQPHRRHCTGRSAGAAAGRWLVLWRRVSRASPQEPWPMSQQGRHRHPGRSNHPQDCRGHPGPRRARRRSQVTSCRQPRAQCLRDDRGMDQEFVRDVSTRTLRLLKNRVDKY